MFRPTIFTQLSLLTFDVQFTGGVIGLEIGRKKKIAEIEFFSTLDLTRWVGLSPNSSLRPQSAQDQMV